MKTKAVISFKDRTNRKIVDILIDKKGYLDKIGKFLKKKILNRKTENINKFAFSLINDLRKKVGQCYLYAPIKDYDKKLYYFDEYEADYYYEIDSNFYIRCWDTISNKEEIIYYKGR